MSGGFGGNFKAIYLNGKLVGSSATSEGPTSDLSSLRLGGVTYPTANYQRIAMDEFAVYNRALSASEINAHYQNGRP